MKYFRQTVDWQDVEMQTDEEERCLQVLLDKGLVRELPIHPSLNQQGRWRRIVATTLREETHVVDDS